MRLHAPRLLLAAVLTATVTACLGLGPAASPAAAGPLDGGLPHVVFVVKDLGGGAYWNVTTSSMYALQAGSELLVEGAETGADLLATLAANGRDLLLLVNGAVLVPLQERL